MAAEDLRISLADTVDHYCDDDDEDCIVEIMEETKKTVEYPGTNFRPCRRHRCHNPR